MFCDLFLSEVDGCERAFCCGFGACAVVLWRVVASTKTPPRGESSVRSVNWVQVVEAIEYLVLVEMGVVVVLIVGVEGD